MSVWRTRRIVPARSMAWMRSMTTGRSTRERRGNFMKWITLETLEAVLGNGKNAGIDGVAGFDGRGG